MRFGNVSAPSKRYWLTNLIKVCGNKADVHQGKKLHEDAKSEGLTSDAFVVSAIVSMYAKFGNIPEAESVFSSLFHLDIVLWNAMLSAYVKQGQGDHTILLYRQMQVQGICADLLTYISVFQACGVLADREKHQSVGGQLIAPRWLKIGRALHSEARMKGYTSDARINTTLISMYAKCGSLTEAENVFSVMHLPSISVVPWNAMISAYVEQGQVEVALWLYSQMELRGSKPDHLTLVFALQACRILVERKALLSMQEERDCVAPLEIGRALHVAAQSRGFAAGLLVGTTLVNLFGKCNAIEEAEGVFCKMYQRSVVSWNAMLSAYVEQGNLDKALLLYRQMQTEGIGRNQQTVVFMLQACGLLAERAKGEQSAALNLIIELGQALHAWIRNFVVVL